MFSNYLIGFRAIRLDLQLSGLESGWNAGEALDRWNRSNCGALVFNRPKLGRLKICRRRLQEHRLWGLEFPRQLLGLGGERGDLDGAANGLLGDADLTGRLFDAAGFAP